MVWIRALAIALLVAGVLTTLLIVRGTVPAGPARRGAMTAIVVAVVPCLALGAIGVAAVSAPRTGQRPLAAKILAMPRTGRLESVHIPGVASGFAGRNAEVWLPPAAIADPAHRFPVIEALSGQPGTPADLVVKGGIVTDLTRIADEHDGVAPVLVIPDQLGRRTVNPMCVNSKLGHVATYLTVDVPAWIRAHLPVQQARTGWTIAGFSEGGTCAIQLGAAHAALYGAVLDVSGEMVPRYGTVTQTVDRAFHGSERAYEAAWPLHVLAAHHYNDMRAVFEVGGLDKRYGPTEPLVARAATVAGMTTTFHVVPGHAHTWGLAIIALAWGLEELVPWWNLPPAPTA